MANDGGQVNEPTSYGLHPPTDNPEAGPDADAPAASTGATRLVPEQPAGEPDEQQGRLLGGRYRLLSRLGHGGMGTVWRALDEVVDREVAVKEPRLPESVADRMRTTVHERMQREARSAARIGHPSVVTVHDVVVEQGQPWLVMELVRGESLADVLETGTVDPREAARIGLAVLEALHAAHEAGVLHRDVKPANVLLGKFDEVVLTDFGIAQVEGEQGLTETGAFVGSPEFIAPERATGQRPGRESDFFSLGVLLYVAIEGVSPFRRNNSAATLQAVIGTDPPPPTRATGELAGLIMGLLAKRPAARPGVSEIRRVLREAANPPQPDLAATQLVGGLPSEGSGTLRLLDRARPKSRKGRWLALGGGLVAVGLVGVLLTTLLSSGGDGEISWEQHDEEAMTAQVSVPDDYRRYEDEDRDVPGTSVAYVSPDRIYTVSIYFRVDETRSPLEAAAGQLAEYRDRTSYESVDGDPSSTEFQEREAARLEVLTAVDGSSNWSVDDEIEDEERLEYTQHLELFHATADGEQLWRLSMSMPGEDGNAKEYGERLFEDIVERLELNDPE